VWWGTFAFDEAPFDWGSDYERPKHSLRDLVIYEMSVRCFTASKSSGLDHDRRGTYLGVADKVTHSRQLMPGATGQQRTKMCPAPLFPCDGMRAAERLS
jgi:hypothetical protein